MERRHSPTKLTYADYLLLPDDDLRHEIIDGEHYVTPSPATRHQRISRKLLYLLESYLREHPIGEVFYAPLDVILSDIDVVVPDLVYVSSGRAHLLNEKNLRGAPDLSIEILSPSTRLRDRRLKRSVYERAGVAEYWLVDPQSETIDVFRRGPTGFLPPRQYSRSDVLTTPMLPGISLPLGQVFSP